MPKKPAYSSIEEEVDAIPEYLYKPNEETVKFPIITSPAHYKPVVWKNIIPTFQCVTCQHCDESEDEMILHVLKHLPAEKHEEEFEQMVARKQKEKP